MSAAGIPDFRSTERASTRILPPMSPSKKRRPGRPSELKEARPIHARIGSEEFRKIESWGRALRLQFSAALRAIIRSAPDRPPRKES